MVDNTDKFTKRVREHISKARELGGRLELLEGGCIGEDNFRQLEKML